MQRITYNNFRDFIDKKVVISTLRKDKDKNILFILRRRDTTICYRRKLYHYAHSNVRHNASLI